MVPKGNRKRRERSLPPGYSWRGIAHHETEAPEGTAKALEWGMRGSRCQRRRWEQAGGESVGEGAPPVLKAPPFQRGCAVSNAIWWVVEKLCKHSWHFIFFLRNVFLFKTPIFFYLWAFTVTAINHHVFCQLKPITFSFVFFSKWFLWGYWWETQLWASCNSSLIVIMYYFRS